ncbi:MAG: hypothetical protein JWL70_2387 [Acidimicrobiia bacterium]|nr:hypothetical protein [Acidimicrobiia bacterium]
MRMKRLVLLAAVVVGGLTLAHQRGATISKPPATTISRPVTVTVRAATECRAQGQLPDPVCAPGVVDPAVTQTNIHTTICIAGYTKKVRPSVGYTNGLKRQQMAAYGDTGPLASFEEDHRVPLEVGGAGSDARNLWPEPITSAHTKDTLENYVHAKICSGAMTLAAGQAVFLGDFVAWGKAHSLS